MFSQDIISWYNVNKRELPWRNTRDPYKIWLSEIILQQTRVDQGLNYYLKFIAHYPSIFELANASENEILNDWQGLGYYSRARNLHATAKMVVACNNGIFPSTYESILPLKGIGPYTAAAIASFAFKEKKALVDGNVYRVLARYFDLATAIDSTVGKKEFQALADMLISAEQPDVYNQAIMEFGSQQCTPVNPNCDACVLQSSCAAFANKTVTERPVKLKKTKVVERFFYFGLFKEQDAICVVQRQEKDIWQKLYQFPLIESSVRLTDNEIDGVFFKETETKPIHISTEVKHLLSHQRIFARFLHFDRIPEVYAHLKIPVSEVQDYPLPRIIDRYLESTSI